MPTVGWIREGDLDAFFEGTERTPDPGPPREPGYSCPFCAAHFPSQSEFQDHVYAKHRVERPFILLRGQEPSAHAVLRSPLSLSDIAVTNASHAKVCLDGALPQQVSTDALRETIAATSQAELNLELVNATEQRAAPVVTHYGLSFRIAQKAELKRVEEAFREILVSEAITRNSIGSFLADKRTQGPGREYASGLADYCLGIIIKERPDGESLTTPFSRYRELYGRALDILKDFPRPLARLITCIIRFSLNNFENGGERTGYWELDLAIELLSNPRENMDITEGGAPPGFVRSPKMSLRRDGPIFVDGRPVEPTDAVAEVLRHLKADAAIARGGAPAHDLARAVFTIPVDFGGPERRALREAARKAGIGVVQFVHEPVAALYAHLRAQPDLGRELARLEGRSILVFDWGGGTLDLTLCRITGGAIMQVRNLGDNEVGGDKFDERLRNHLRERHASAHGLEDITALEQPGMAAKLLHQCEILKIHLSDPKVDTEDVIVRNYLKVDGPGKNLLGSVTRAELEKLSSGIVARGLARIDEILEQAQLTYQDIELCLATGGMVNMPAIRDGLTERFVGRVPRLENGDRIIAEGAAWIANDGLRLKLSKPIEILVADTSGRGTYHSLVDAGWTLPIENETQNVANTRLFCVDPREGVAVVEVAKPVKLGKTSPSDPRRSLCVVKVQVDPMAQPLLERIECNLQIDHDYVARVSLRSTGRGAETSEEFHDLEFGLSLAAAASPDRQDDERSTEGQRGPIGQVRALSQTNLYQRTNVARLDERTQALDDLWKLVPGDIIGQWRPGHFDTRSNAASQRQHEERYFYVPCPRCRRRISQIKAEGPVQACLESPNYCGFERPRQSNHPVPGTNRTL